VTCGPSYIVVEKVVEKRKSQTFTHHHRNDEISAGKNSRTSNEHHFATALKQPVRHG
jgi:hypothetical protein